MKKFMKLLGVFVLCVFFSLSFSCQNPETVVSSNNPDPATLAGQEPAQEGNSLANTILDIGQVTWIDLEGGFWGIVGTKGNYDPTNLPKDFCVNGLWVIFLAQPVTDMVSIHQWGTLVKILRIEKLPDQIISDVGIVNQSGIQGKPWLIEGTKATYQPINLPDKYKVVGLKVKFTARLKTDIVIAPPVWPRIEIITISVVPEPPVYFNVGEKFRLPVTCTAIEKNANIKLLFEKVISDSRCPTGAQCLVAGYAQVSVRISVAGVDYGSIILDTDQSKELRNIGGYRFSLLDLEPYPVLKNTIPPQRQVGVFLVEKAPQPQVVFKLGEAFKLPVTQTAIEPDAGIDFTFARVLSDSRCPRNAICIWAGEATIEVGISIGESYTQVFTLSTWPGKNSVEFGDYNFTFKDLMPYPVLDPSIDVVPKYVGIFLVEKKLPPTPDPTIVPTPIPTEVPTPIPTEVPTPIPPVTFRLGEIFKLPVTQTAIEPDAKIELTFSEVIQDNRCPQLVECYTAGDAIVAVKIAIEGIQYGGYKLSLMTGPSVRVGNYIFTFKDLNPYPVAGKDRPAGYVGSFLVEKAVPDPIYFTLGKEFKLPIKRTGIEPDAKIEFVFEELLSDTRCAVCDSIDAGEAIIVVRIAIEAVDYGKLRLSTNPRANTVIVGKHSFKFNNLYPFPGMEMPITPDGYIGYFIVDEPSPIIIQG